MLKLLKRKSFRALTATQFLGAFNDNAFKMLVLLLVASLGSDHALSWVESSWVAQNFGQAAPAFLFALPFVFLGPLTGALADRLSKTAIIRAANLLEIGVMLGATLGLVLRSYDGLLLTVFLMGVQSALFGPAKYGVIKELVGGRDLSRANALIQASTMIAILLGNVVGGFLAEHLGGAMLPWAGAWYVSFALVGWFWSLRIEQTPAVNPERVICPNPFVEFRSHWRATDGDRDLVLSLIASAFFYMVAALFVTVVISYGNWLGLPETRIGLLNAATIIGIVVGAWAAGRVSGDRTEGGLVPLGLILMSLGTLLVQWNPESVELLRLSLFCMGFGAGLFSIPIRCLIQGLPAPEQRGSIQGLAETMDFVGILLAGPLFLFLEKGLQLTPPQMFLVGSCLMGLGAIASLVLAGQFLARFVLMFLTRTRYRLRVLHADRVPDHGGALIVSNHVSFVDAMLVYAACPRPVRFLMFRDYFEMPMVGWFVRRMGAIPVSSKDTDEQKAEALARAADMVRRGHLVCLFSEGAITRTGSLLPFSSGFARIAEQTGGAPIIPMSLDRVWGSLFSFSKSRFFEAPLSLGRPVDVAFGQALPTESSAPAVRAAVAELIAEQRLARGGWRGSLGFRLLVAAHKNRRNVLLSAEGREWTGAQLLEAVLERSFALDRCLPPHARVGLLLPRSTELFLMQLAVTLSGRSVAVLDPEWGAAALDDLVVRARLDVLVHGGNSSHPIPNTVPMEQILTAITPGDRRRARRLQRMPPALSTRLIVPHQDAGDLALIFFSSGASGAPKVVEASHACVLSNVQSLLQVLVVGSADRVVSALPPWSPLGQTCGLWASLLGGAVHCLDVEGGRPDPSPATILLGTPSDYRAWIQDMPGEGALPDLRIAIAGGRHVSQELFSAFSERTGMPLLAGFGATELCPAVSVNLPNPPGQSPRHHGLRPGSVGRPLPGVAVRIADDEGAWLSEPDQEGWIEVKGPNVMSAGFGADGELLPQALAGWCRTGDRGHLDRDGFLWLDETAAEGRLGGDSETAAQ